MSVAVTCRTCRARLKTPPGCTKTKIRCPKCNARMNISAALSASAYARAKPAAAADTPLPPPAPEPPAPPPLPKAAEREEDPLPYVSLDPKPPAVPPPLPAARPHDEPPLSLDDEPPAAAPPPEGPPPFRVAARVTADTAGQFTGPCEVVLVPHGLFLESIRFRPFLYAPVGSPAFTPTRRAVVVSLPDGRAVTVELLGRLAERVAEDVAAFLARERGVPEAREYRRSPPWLLILALIFALGLGAGPVAAARAVDLPWETGLLWGAAFATAGLVFNAAVALLTRLPVVGKVAVMALVAVAGTGVCLLAAAAYLAGLRNQPPPPDPPSAPPRGPRTPGTPGAENGGEPGHNPPERYLPTAVDVAYRDGVYRFEDGPADVTAMAVGVEGTVLVVGYRDGSTRVWRLDQPAIEPFSAGPRSDGPPSRIEFDGTGAVVYMTCGGGTVAALWNDPPAAPVKIPGEHFAAFPFPAGERFATQRGNTLVLRYVPTDLVKKPRGKEKGFTVTAPREEVQPIDVKAQLASAGRLTFLAWHPTGKLLGGLSDGSVMSWGATGPTPTLAAREHKAAVRAWAASPATWDFATGDDRGVVGLWENKAMRPRTFTGASGAVTQLVYSPSGSHLAVADASGAVRVWDLADQRAIVRVSRVGAQVAFGPNDDTVLLSDGKRVELWALGELAKQP